MNLKEKIYYTGNKYRNNVNSMLLFPVHLLRV